MMLDLDSLRLTGGTGSINDVGPSLGIGIQLRISVRVLRKRSQIFIDDDHAEIISLASWEKLFRD